MKSLLPQPPLPLARLHTQYALLFRSNLTGAGLAQTGHGEVPIVSPGFGIQHLQGASNAVQCLIDIHDA